MTKLKHVEMYTDGACSHNPGPGGWAVLLRFGENEKTFTGGEEETTNNRMELMAAIMGLRALKEPCRVTLSTDSEYVKKGITEWLENWKRNGWRTANRKPVKNQDLWLLLEKEIERHHIKWEWVKGHSGHIENDIVDELAKNEVIKLIKNRNSE